MNITTTVKDDKQLGDLKAHQEWKREQTVSMRRRPQRAIVGRLTA